MAIAINHDIKLPTSLGVLLDPTGVTVALSRTNFSYLIFRFRSARKMSKVIISLGVAIPSRSIVTVTSLNGPKTTAISLRALS